MEKNKIVPRKEVVKTPVSTSIKVKNDKPIRSKKGNDRIKKTPNGNNNVNHGKKTNNSDDVKNTNVESNFDELEWAQIALEKCIKNFKA